MNKFAQLLYGKVVYIYETNLNKEQLTQYFSPQTYWVDVTGLECKVGYIATMEEGLGLILTAPEPVELTFDNIKTQKLAEIDAITRQHIIGGFISNAKGSANTYDSTEEDQMTFATMYAASRSTDFTTNETYHGQIPIRAVPAGQSEKVVLQHNASEMQKLIDDLALHIGGCKQIGWTLQEQVAAATTKEELEKITWPL